MSNVRTVDNILYEALYHAETRASGLTAQESAMYRGVRADIEKYGSYVEAHKRAPEYDTRQERSSDALDISGILDDSDDSDGPKPEEGSKKTPIVFKVAPEELTRRLDDAWPVDEETGEDLPVSDVSRPALVQEARRVLQELLNGFVPTAVTVRLVDLYVAVRKEYDSQVKLLESRAGISDERRPSMRERFEVERLQSASESLAEAAPYRWGRTSLVVG